MMCNRCKCGPLRHDDMNEFIKDADAGCYWFTCELLIGACLVGH